MFRKKTGGKMPTSESKKCTFGSCRDLDSCPRLQAILPELSPGSGYKVCQYEETGRSGIVCRFRLPCQTSEEVKAWVKEFEESSLGTWRINKTYPKYRKKIAFKLDMRCHHHTNPRSATADYRRGSKNTNCPSTMGITIKRVISDKRGRNRSGDIHIGEGFPTLVVLNWIHNHEVASADALRKRDVGDETKEKLLQLFRAGHSPSSALEILKYDLQADCTTPEEYARLSADRAYCPDLQFCYRLFYKEFRQQYGDVGGDNMMHFLEAKINDLNAEEEFIKMQTTSDGQIIIAICTPLMKRVHQMWKNSQELVFVDSSGNMDRKNCHMFLFLTHSPSGALPLGVVITSSESESTLKAAFKLLQSLCPEDAFFGNGTNGPNLFMTDDCKALRLALHDVYPKSLLLLCVFHLLQAMWRWLSNSHYNVEEQDRPHLLNIFKTMVYAETEEILQARFADVTRSATAQKYPAFLDHVEEVYKRKEEWALAHRADLRIGGNHTTAYCEAVMRVLKDKIFFRPKVFNICQLTDFILTRFEDYYVRKLTDLSSNRMIGNTPVSRFFPCSKDVPVDGITKCGDKMYSVQSAKGNSQYHVNMDIDTCTCPVGKSGAPCKHKAAVVTKFSNETASENFLPLQSPEPRRLLYKIATGRAPTSMKWFQPLKRGLLQNMVTDDMDDNTCEDVVDQDDNVNTQDLVAQDSEYTQIVVVHDDDENMQDVVDQDDNANTQDMVAQDNENSQDVVGHDDDENTQDVVGRDDNENTRTQDPKVKEDLNCVFQTIQSKLAGGSVEFEGAVKHFIGNFNRMNTDSHLVSAFHTFGKYGGASLAIRHKSIKACGLLTSTKMGMQPAAVARRKMPVVDPRCHTVGRPVKSSFTSEHGYSKRKSSTYTQGDLPRKRHTATPHSLALCVDEDVSLEKTHTSK